LRKKAFEIKKRIVFPEGDDIRIKEATEYLRKNTEIEPVVISNDSIKVDENMIDEFYSINSKRLENKEQAKDLLKSSLYYSGMLLRRGEVDGFVGGAANTTSETVRALLRTIGKKGTVSGFFIMILPDGRKFIFADCAVIPDPTSEQLADIAEDSAKNCRIFLEEEPKVALLSFSTLGSAKSFGFKKVREAVKILEGRKVDFDFIGEIQLDAAISKEVAKKKIINREWSGANVLIFPDLNSGNIGYKLVERMANARAIGPILQGLKKPANDLSRGCSVEDIIDVSCITALQSYV